MQYILSLVLDKDCQFFLSLKQFETLRQMDEFTSKNFLDSDEIRNKYQRKIEEYLSQNQEQLKKIGIATGRNFRGSIVILQEVKKNGKIDYIRKSIVYKKHVLLIPYMVCYQEVMKQFVKEDFVVSNETGIAKLIDFKNYQSREIKRRIYKKSYHTATNTKAIASWIKRKKEDSYRKIRLLIKAYERIRSRQLSEQKTNILPTIDSLYKTYLNDKKTSKEKVQVQEQPDERKMIEEEMHQFEGVKFHLDEMPFDLEDLLTMDTDFHPDGLGPKL